MSSFFDQSVKTISQSAMSLGENNSRVITAAEFCRLLISHRRMVRVDRREQHLRGLQDLDTGEIFYTHAARLVTHS